MSVAGYTEEARRHHVEGRVRVTFEVTVEGVAKRPRIVEGLGYGLDEAVLDQVRAMKFTPGTLCGVPVPSEFTLSMRYVLDRPRSHDSGW